MNSVLFNHRRSQDSFCSIFHQKYHVFTSIKTRTGGSFRLSCAKCDEKENKSIRSSVFAVLFLIFLQGCSGLGKKIVYDAAWACNTPVQQRLMYRGDYLEKGLDTQEICSDEHNPFAKR